MSTLYELTHDLLEIENEEAIIGTVEEIKTKLQDYCVVIADKKAEVEKFKAEIKRLNDHATTINNEIINMRQRMEDALITLGIDKVNTGLFKIALQVNPPSVVYVNDADIPDCYKKTVVSVDKTLLKKALKNGTEIPGVTLTQTRSLRIR